MKDEQNPLVAGDVTLNAAAVVGSIVACATMALVAWLFS